MQAENIQGRCYTVTVTVELTDRELEVINLLGQGMRQKQVAEQLNIALSTVKKHVENARTKTNTEGLGIAAVVSAAKGAS